LGGRSSFTASVGARSRAIRRRASTLLGHCYEGLPRRIPLVAGGLRSVVAATAEELRYTHWFSQKSEVTAIVLVLLLVLVLDLLAIRAEKRADLSATVLVQSAWHPSGCFSRLRAQFQNFGILA
jgi:hypothetical protein